LFTELENLRIRMKYIVHVISGYGIYKEAFENIRMKYIVHVMRKLA